MKRDGELQVLVLAAQNAIDDLLLSVATSGATPFGQVGGSIGVCAFGPSSRTNCAASSRRGRGAGR